MMQEVDMHILPGMHVHLRNSTGTIAALAAGSDPSFSYVPFDGSFGANRSLPGYYALGDLAMRIRCDELSWQCQFDSSAKTAHMPQCALCICVCCSTVDCKIDFHPYGTF